MRSCAYRSGEHFQYFDDEHEQVQTFAPDAIPNFQFSLVLSVFLANKHNTANRVAPRASVSPHLSNYDMLRGWPGLRGSGSGFGRWGGCLVGWRKTLPAVLDYVSLFQTKTLRYRDVPLYTQRNSCSSIRSWRDD